LRPKGGTTNFELLAFAAQGGCADDVGAVANRSRAILLEGPERRDSHKTIRLFLFRLTFSSFAVLGKRPIPLI
jgi:hypothetical protein